MGRMLLIAAVVLLVSSSVALAQGASPSDVELAALESLKGKLTGTLIWESNRTGHWELYVANANGTGARKLTNFAPDGKKMPYGDYLRPQISPDGKWATFAYSATRPKPCEVWIVDMETGEARSLTEGAPLNWTADGSGIFYVYESNLWKIDLVAGETRRLNNVKLPVDGAYGSMVGSVLQDLSAAIFRSSRTNEYFVMNQAKTVKTMGGCESRFTTDGRYLYWVQGPKDFRVWDMQADTEHQVLGTPPVEPFNYTYCPTITDDNRWMLYGASPNQHSHTTSDYEVYVQELRDLKPTGQPVRLSFNGKTDRWPYIWLGDANPLPDGPYDVAGNPNMNPPPPPLSIFTFADNGAGPDMGGAWGTWPEEGACRAVATYVDEDAADGGGGSMRIDYRIGGDPNAVAVWITPNGGTLDLTAYDRLAIYARGDIPSFTVVAKDRNDDGSEVNGSADYFVKGVTGKWQRFELPLSKFQPRERGAAFDWRSVKLVSIALVGDRDEPEGMLQIDNITALPIGAN